MAWLQLSLVCLTVFSEVSSFVNASKTEPLLKVTDDNWHILLEGEWMVEFMAPWCPACRSFQSTWQSLAEWSKDLEINVGIIDITENPGMSGRFLVTSLPTIIHVKDGEFRTYSGARKESDLLSFVDDKKWQDVKPVSSWLHPGSLQMEALSFFFRFAMKLRMFYNMLTAEYGIPEWACYVIFAVLTLIIGLLLGLLIVLCCDWMFPPKYIPPHSRPKLSKEQQELLDNDDESDVIEDYSPEETEKTPTMEEERKDEDEEEFGDTTGVRRRQTGGKMRDENEEESEES